MTRPGLWRDEGDDYRDLMQRVKRLEMATVGDYGASITPDLPSSPNDGQDFYYALPDGGQWHFKFSYLTGVWDFVGGSSLADEVVTSESTASASYVDLSTVGPSITIPFAGEYDISGHCGIYIPTGSGAYAKVAAKLGSASTSDNDRVAQFNSNGAAGATQGGMFGSRIRRTLASGDVVKLQYVSSGATISFEFRRLMVAPVYTTP